MVVIREISCSKQDYKSVSHDLLSCFLSCDEVSKPFTSVKFNRLIFIIRLSRYCIQHLLDLICQRDRG